MTKRERFIKKYGIDPIEAVDKALLKWVDNEYIQKQPETTMNTYFEENKIDIDADRHNTEFWIYLIEAFQEAGEKWPTGWRNILSDDIPILDPTPINPQPPKEKPVLDTFKDIVSDDEFRPNLTGVYVDKDSLVGTDAYKMLIIKNDEYKKYDGKIINLDIYLKSKGRKIDFIDGRYPDYKSLFEKETVLLAKSFPLYNLYNLSKSTAKFLQYLEKDKPFPITFKMDEFEEVICMSPVLLTDVITAAMQNGYTTCDWYATKQEVPQFILDFGQGSKGLIMPIATTERATPPITLKRILDEFGGTQKGSKPKPIVVSVPPTPKPSPQPKPAPKQSFSPNKITGVFEKARYAKDKIAYHPPKSESGWKNREMRLAEAKGVNGKWSNREGAYIMSKSQAEKLKEYLIEGKDAEYMTANVYTPDKSIKVPTKPAPAPKTEKSKELEMLEKMILLNLSDI